MKRSSWIYAAVAAALCAAPAIAQYKPSWQWPSERFNPQTERDVAGKFDYYSLVLSWSPTYCSESGDRDDMQCNRPDGRRFSFVLHGLWPQYERGFPNSCRTARKPFVPQELINRMLDIMPSPRLVIHEYRKHGTCSGLNADLYFAHARQMFEGVKIPERFKNPYESQFESPDTIAKEFARANPGMTPDMMGVVCGGAGNRLKEIRFCFTKDGKPRNCGDNEDQRKLCRADKMFIPPVRSTARDSDSSSRYDNDNRSGGTSNKGYRQNPLPAPRDSVDGDSL